MNYFDYLNKRLADVQPGQQQFYVNPSVSNPFSAGIFGGNLPTVNFNGASVFTKAKKEDVGNLDYEKLLSDDQNISESDKKMSPLEFILKEFLSLDKVQKDADSDKSGDLTPEEAKKFIEKLLAKDDNAEELSLEDFEAIIEELGIDLEELSQEEQTEQAEQQQPEVQQPEVQNQSVVTHQTQNRVPAYNHTAPAPVSAGRSGGGHSGRVSAAAPAQTGSIDSMSLTELETEKTKRETTLSEKQSAVNAVNNGQNENVKAAKADETKAKEEYESAIKDDPGAKKFAKDISSNNKKLVENQQALDKNTVDISKKEDEISNAEDSLSGAKNELSSYESALSALGSDEKNKDKKASLTKLISNKKKDVKSQEKQLDNLKKDLEKLKKEKSKLEEEKSKLEKTKLELDEKVKQFCQEETKAKLEAYNKAKENTNKVKKSELEKANNELKTAKDAVKEINEKIRTAKASQIKNEYSDTPVMDINSVPASFRNQYGVTEKTLPDGTKVLGCRWTRFGNCQPEWIYDQQAMLNAAQDMGMTLVYSDVERTVAESNAGRARKGALVCRGGESPHNYGVAADIVLFKDGQPVNVNSSLQTAFARKAQEYSNNSITWGGDWRKKGERHHFEVRGWQNKYKNSGCLVG